jgi:uncharacterized protein (TIGR00290 family)
MKVRKKIWVSWSTGKDSAYTLYKLLQDDEIEVTGLLSIITETYDRVSMHGVRKELLEKQIQNIGIPLHSLYIPAFCSFETYDFLYRRFLVEQAVNNGVTHIAYGDIFLEHVKNYRKVQLHSIGLNAIFPLWKQNTDALARGIINAGIKATICCLDPKKLHRKFIKMDYNHEFLKEIPSGVDPCAEQGEFHTVVYDGPMFRNPLSIFRGEIVEREGLVFKDVV